MFARAALRHAALAALVPLLVLGSGPGRALYRCIYDQVARTHCCCPTAAEPHAPVERSVNGIAPALCGGATSVSPACCCDVERPTGDAARIQVRIERTETPQPRLFAAAVSPLPRAGLLSAAAALHPPRVGLDPPPGPSLLLVKRSFLI